MTLSQERLEELLPDRRVRYYAAVDSTQDIAGQWLLQGAESGSVVVADEQLRGRGRYGRTWYTPPNVAIAMSIVLYPRVETLSRITMLGALAIYDVIRKLGAEDVTIKWPNDVRLNGRKVCGVLPEAAWEGDHLKGVCLGIGINVRFELTDNELAKAATSIEPEIGQVVDRSVLIQTLLQRIDFWQARLTTPEILDTWRSRLGTIGQQIEINGIEGFAIGIDHDGALRVKDSNGDVHRILAGDVALG